MQRRDFLKIASALSTVVPSWALTPAAFAQTAEYTGKVLINVHAAGGIDQSSWTDPRGSDPLMNNYVNVAPVGVAGNIRYAPMGGRPAMEGESEGIPPIGPNSTNKTFFDKYHSYMLVINGVHSQTNSHEDGTRVHATGRLDLGYPNVAELFAYTHGSGLPMPWLNGGGFGSSAGLVPPSAIPDQTTITALGSPNSKSSTQTFMKEADFKHILKVRKERLMALEARKDLLPRYRQVIDQFLDAATSRGMLDKVAQYTSDGFDVQHRQAHIALIAVKAGITTTVQLSTGGFDGHNNITNGYSSSLTRLTNLIDFIWRKAAELGLTDRIFLRIYSEFGRTPLLNTGNGKDHWTVGSQILMQANAPWGNRVFGASGPRHQAMKFTRAGVHNETSGKYIYPRHIHAAMRDYLGINTSDPKFDLKLPADEGFDFFNKDINTGYPNI